MSEAMSEAQDQMVVSESGEVTSRGEKMQSVAKADLSKSVLENYLPTKTFVLILVLVK